MSVLKKKFYFLIKIFIWLYVIISSEQTDLLEANKTRHAIIYPYW